MKKIVCATDGSTHAERAVDLASDVAAKFGAELILVHVIPDKPLSSEERHLAEIEFQDELRKYPGSGLATEFSSGGGLVMRDVVRTSWGWGYQPGPLYPAVYVLTMAGVATGLAVIRQTFRSSHSPAERRQRPWLFAGLSFPLLVASITDAPASSAQ